MIYAFLVEKMKRVWGYTLFWMGIGMLIMFFVGGGLLGVLLIAAQKKNRHTTVLIFAY